MRKDGDLSAPSLWRRRGVALLVAVVVVIVCLGLGLVISNGAVSRSVTTNARFLHWTNAMLGSAALARAGNAQAVVFAVDRDLGVASIEALDGALAEGRATLESVTQTVAAEPVGYGDPAGEIDSAVDDFVVLDGQVLDLIEMERVEEAVELSQGDFETKYQGLQAVLTAEQNRLSEVIDETEGTLGRVASIASVLATLLIPAAAVVVYFLLARRQLRDRRIALDAELEAERELSRAKDEFIGGLSHELRTPLTSIYGFSEVLLETGLVDPRQTMELISLINTESADLSRMVEDLLTAARIEANALSFEIGEVSPISEVESVVEPFRRAGLSITVSCPRVVVLADRLRLRQVLRNLVSNAHRHGGPHIRIKAREVDGVLRIAVIDDGPGVSPDVADRLFERFVHDGRGALLAGSVGLGLAIARSLMAAMGGTIDYTRVDGQTVFSFSLPVVTQPDTGGHQMVVDIDDWHAGPLIPVLVAGDR